MSGRQNLREYALDGHGPPRWITHGTINDRQPVFAPGGEWVVFSSNRSGNLDLWAVSTRTGVVRSITDDPADDWDPAFSPDGRSLLWSSNRSGNLEIWASNPDGTGAHQVTHDGEDAQNPTQTRDGQVDRLFLRKPQAPRPLEDPPGWQRGGAVGAEVPCNSRRSHPTGPTPPI